MTDDKFKLLVAIIWTLLLLARLCGRIVGVSARMQTRLLTKAQDMGWIPTDFEAMKLLHRQHELTNFEMNKRRMKALRNQPKRKKS